MQNQKYCLAKQGVKTCTSLKDKTGSKLLLKFLNYETIK